MNKTIKKLENVYTDLKDLYENFIPAATIFFDGDTYEQTDTTTKNNKLIHIYRCDKELHTLKIVMKNGSPFLINGVYEMNS
ncbi:hypothetical protein PVA17_23720 [Lysinibacillus sp. CNPSo 3705]|uniref:hypothetical protein n=1 Tax=Lysinibacillus sp. CNPSo 3705 TaxID=3028148 RepID=UPI0023645A29|nr:hypothetical protein [Lysinibacillus sp. CNPSo 3705]MDD1505732.1 hypothetical protein [Lysinibacillus sp. CNPSo 3705]